MKFLKSLVLIVPVVLGVLNNNLSEVKDNNHRGVYYDNFKYTDNVNFNGSEGLNIDYSAELKQVGDYYELVFDVINDSDVDVEVSNCDYNDDDKYIDYYLAYADGKEINEGDILKKGESKKLKYRVLYKNSITEDNYEFDSSFSIRYEQKI